MVAEYERGIVVEGGYALNVVNYCMLSSFRQRMVTMESLETRNGVQYAQVYCIQLGDS